MADNSAANPCKHENIYLRGHEYFSAEFGCREDDFRFACEDCGEEICLHFNIEQVTETTLKCLDCGQIREINSKDYFPDPPDF